MANGGRLALLASTSEGKRDRSSESSESNKSDGEQAANGQQRRSALGDCVAQLGVGHPLRSARQLQVMEAPRKRRPMWSSIGRMSRERFDQRHSFPLQGPARGLLVITRLVVTAAPASSPWSTAEKGVGGAGPARRSLLGINLDQPSRRGSASGSLHDRSGSSYLRCLGSLMPTLLEHYGLGLASRKSYRALGP